MTARRNVRCILCRQMRPAWTSERATINGVPGVWVCNRCTNSKPDPPPSETAGTPAKPRPRGGGSGQTAVARP